MTITPPEQPISIEEMVSRGQAAQRAVDELIPCCGRHCKEHHPSRGGVPSFTCPKCQMTSYNPNDVREGYCGYCHAWTGKGTS